MAEVLSQSQIDMLLSSMRAGNDGPKETKADEKPEEQYKNTTSTARKSLPTIS